MTKAELLTEANKYKTGFRTWTQFETAVDEYTKALLQQTPCSALRESLVQKKMEVLKAREQTKDSYEKARLLDQWKDYQTALQVIEELQHQ